MITNILDKQPAVSCYLTCSSLTTELDLVVESLGHVAGFLNLHGNAKLFVKSSGLTFPPAVSSSDLLPGNHWHSPSFSFLWG